MALRQRALETLWLCGRVNQFHIGQGEALCLEGAGGEPRDLRRPVFGERIDGQAKGKRPGKDKGQAFHRPASSSSTAVMTLAERRL